MKIELKCKKFDSITGQQFPTKREIETFAYNHVKEYCKQFGRKIEEFYVDEFVTKYLGIDIQYQRLSLDNSKLGTTILRDGKIATYADDGTPKLIEVRKGDIFIDSDACGNENRENFTILHEVKHYLLDLNKNYRTNQIFEDETTIENLFRVKGDVKWDEYYANHFAGCVLLPRKYLTKRYRSLHEEKLSAYHKNSNGKNIKYIKHIIRIISAERKVSQCSVAFRLKDTKLISKETFNRLDYNFAKSRNYDKNN